MKKIRDLIYDANDILITIVIVAIAAGIIAWRVSSVMAYSNYVAKNDPEQTIDIDFSGIDLEKEEEIEFSDPSLDDPADVDPNVITDPSEINENFKSTKEVQVAVPKGSSLVKIAGLTADAYGYTDEVYKAFVTQFTNKAKELQLESKMQVGTFTIPKDSDFETIVKILAMKK